jgi:SAM-dependent methyltransferase
MELISKRFSVNASSQLDYLSAKQMKYRDEVVARLGKEYKLVSNPCPCKNPQPQNDKVISQIDRYGLPLSSVLCSSCGTVRLDPYFDEKGLADFYTDHYQEMYGRSNDLAPYFEKQKQYGRKFLATMEPRIPLKSTVLEFGCGAGGALWEFKNAGHIVYGCEYSQKLIDYGITRGVENLYYGGVVDIEEKLQGVKFDLIFSNHVFEHVNKPFEYLQSCLNLLKPSGKIVCAVPDLYNSHRFIFPNSDLRMMLHVAHIYNYTFKCIESLASQLNVHVARLSPNPELITPTSVMPELWFEISVNRGIESETGATQWEKSGKYMEYFLETEKNLTNGTNLLKQPTSLTATVKSFIKKFVRWKR